MKQKRIKRTDDEWLELIRQYQSSGMTMKAWCAEHGISTATFYNRLHRVKNKPDITTLSVIQTETAGEQHIVPLSIIDSDTCTEDPVPVSGTDAAVSLTIGRCHVVIHNRADRETVKHTLYALQQIC